MSKFKQNESYDRFNNSKRNDHLDDLKVQVNQEEQLKQAVEQSYHELLNTSKELEKRMNMIDEEIQFYDHLQEVKYSDKKPPLIMYEGNEWKTRFENQEEINRQLSKQISLLESKLEDIKSKAKNVKNKVSIENKNESAPEYVSELHRTKDNLLAQLKDYNWRLEQENKAYHIANEDRKELQTQLQDSRNILSLIKERNESTTKLGNATYRTGNKHGYLPSIDTYRGEDDATTNRYDESDNDLENERLNRSDELALNGGNWYERQQDKDFSSRLHLPKMNIS